MMKTLKYILYKEGRFYVSQCLNVELSSFGDTPREAIRNLNEALQLYFGDKEELKFIAPVEDVQIGETKVNIPVNQ